MFLRLVIFFSDGPAGDAGMDGHAHSPGFSDSVSPLPIGRITTWNPFGRHAERN